jgi:hypothetical protein
MSVGKEYQVASIPRVVATRGSINETLCCNSEHVALLTFPVIVKSESPVGSGAIVQSEQAPSLSGIGSATQAEALANCRGPI